MDRGRGQSSAPSGVRVARARHVIRLSHVRPTRQTFAQYAWAWCTEAYGKASRVRPKKTGLRCRAKHRLCAQVPALPIQALELRRSEDALGESSGTGLGERESHGRIRPEACSTRQRSRASSKGLFS
jgi:hypothetical protein